MRVVIGCGGSGGHIFPGIALAEELAKRGDVEIRMACSSKPLDIQILKKSGFNFEVMPYNPFAATFNPLRIFLFLARSIEAFFLSVRLLVRFRPDCVIGFGGFVSGPVIFAAWLLRIPRLIHEQNLIAGLANRIESLFAQRIAVSFEDTKRFFNRRKVIKVGNPVRSGLSNSSKTDSRSRLSLDQDRFTVFITGGSQGAASLNKVVVNGLSSMDGREKARLQVIHVSGEKDCGSVNERYIKENIRSKVFSFLDDVDTAYAASDLVIARAGATTIAELIYLGKPSVLIPYPKRSVHQIENANFLSNNKAAVAIEEKDLTPDSIKKVISGFLQDARRLEEISGNAKRLGNPDASRLLAEEVLALSRGAKC